MTTQQAVALGLATAITIANFLVAADARRHRHRAETAAARAQAANQRTRTAQRLLHTLAPDDTTEEPPVQCWHTEAGTPCDWDVCKQPERLAVGDYDTDPKEQQ